MASIIPFKALRPEAQFAKQVASKPYDVLNSKEARIEVQGNPYSFLHITKSEIDLPENTDHYSQKVYNKAKENLDAFISRKVLFQENKPCYYVYQIVMGHGEKLHTQTGLVCCSAIKDYETDVIKKHEFTTPEKELDRINHIKTTGAQTGNVFMAYKNVEEIDELIKSRVTSRDAVYNFIGDDSVQHAIWIINDEDTIKKITTLFKEKVPFTYIADGHHRAASAAKAKNFFGENVTAAKFFLTTLFPSSQLKILPYNRVIKDLNGLTKKEFLEKAGEKFAIEKTDTPFLPSEPHTFGMYLTGNWYKLTAKDKSFSNEAEGSLDITILQNNLLQPVLGIGDQRTDKRIEFVGGIRGLKELEMRVNSGEAAIAFSFYPVTADQLFAVADSGEVMPPKSTWFEPKLRDGLLTHLIV